MKQSYPEDIMLCFVEGFGNSIERGYNKNRELIGSDVCEVKITSKSKTIHEGTVLSGTSAESLSEEVEIRRGVGKSLRLSSRERLKTVSELKRSFSDRFSIINDVGKKKPPKDILTIKKTWSTGNFAASGGGAAGGGCGAPRSAPATPLQLEPHARAPKHDKHVMKPLSGSAPSVRVTALNAAEDDAAEGKVPSKSRQKKFQRHFPQVGPDERVLNYYSCALVGDLLLQGHLYITKNYFAFYSNVFGYVTKLLIPTTSVLRISKEKVARIIPNAVGVCTRDERHVFGSLLSRDATYKLMMLVWKAARVPELAVPPPQVLRASGVELDASEYSPEDDSSSACAEPAAALRTPAGGGAVGAGGALGAAGGVGVVGGAAVIQPALLTGGVAARRSPQYWRAALALAAVVLACSAALLAYRLLHHQYHASGGGGGGGEQLYAELVRWRSRLHGRAADELHAFLNTNLLLLTKVRQSLEALSGVILTDMGHEAADTAFS